MPRRNGLTYFTGASVLKKVFYNIETESPGYIFTIFLFVTNEEAK
jgi:hypothetical protein